MNSRLRSINILLLFIMCFGAFGFMPKPVTAQDRAVGMGDIALILINTDNADSLAFVVLADLAEGEVIRFTDSGWQAEGGFRFGEGGIAYSVPTGGITAGTIVYQDNPFTLDNWSENNSGLGTNGFSLQAAGDQIIVFQGDAISPSLIYALNNEDAGIWQADATDLNTSAMPTGLTNGTDAIALIEIDNAKLNCTGNIRGTKAQLLAYISNNLNWIGSDSVRQSIDTGCSFTVQDPTAVGPQVSSTTPADEAMMIGLNSDIQIEFTELMNLAPGWFEIDCSVSGLHTASVNDANPIFTLNPDGDFVNNEVCTVTIFGIKVTEYMAPGLPAHMEEDHIFSFSTLMIPMINQYFLPLIVK